MRKIRLNTFETNSSSTHSLIICSKEDYDKLVSHEYYLDGWDRETILNGNEVDKFLVKDMADYPEDYTDCKNREECLQEFLNKHDRVITLDIFKDIAHDNGLETFTDFYTSKSGDEIVAFGYYGYDG